MAFHPASTDTSDQLRERIAALSAEFWRLLNQHPPDADGRINRALRLEAIRNERRWLRQILHRRGERP